MFLHDVVFFIVFESHKNILVSLQYNPQHRQ